MEVKSYLSPLAKWWWLLLISCALALGTSYYVVNKQPPIYKSTTTLLIGQMITNPNPSNNDFWLSQQLANLYSDVAKRDPIRNATLTALGLKNLPVYDVHPLPNSQLIEIVVTDQNPEVTWRVAQELAHQLILQSPSTLQPEEKARQDFIHKQMDDTRKAIEETQKEISQKQEELGTLTSAKDIADEQQAIQTLETKLTLLGNNFASLAVSSQSNASNILTVIDPAILPTTPIGPNKWVIVAIAGFIGLALGSGAAFLLEYLDDSLKSPEDIHIVQNLPILSLISEMEKTANQKPYLVEQPRSLIAESFRTLRATLELFPRKPLKTIFLTSPEPGDGKTSIAINLALVFAQGGKRVILLDADMRHPCAHERLGLANVNGLGEVLNGRVDLMNTIQMYEVENLSLIPAGDVKRMPLDNLDQNRAGAIVKELTQIADMVIIDGAPLFVSDALIWASVVDGVILVVRPGHTRKTIFTVMVDHLERMGVNLLGVVFNRIRSRDAGPYGNYKYYSSYYPKAEKGEQAAPLKNKKSTKNVKEKLRRTVRIPALGKSKLAG
ncbi:MAG TPA: polysaccharide biosynthesis tyrosine autokinase [Anaerolineaceae bacterium]|nr:polysaccharide biosynthesis tyrosine autokinase [Anaerolineaceae bacterium]